MARYYGQIGFFTSEEQVIDGIATGNYINHIIERPYYGDVIRNTRRLANADSANDNIELSNNISIVADAYANENFAHIAYVTFMGTRWKATSADVQPPRIILSLGGVYNGQTP